MKSSRQKPFQATLELDLELLRRRDETLRILPSKRVSVDRHPLLRDNLRFLNYEAMIVLHSSDVAKIFESGRVKFKILKCSEEDKLSDMLTKAKIHTKEEYETLLYATYHPLIFVCPLHLRIAYLFGCLNEKFRTPRKETFLVFFQKDSVDDWRPWFSVYPYRDSIYGDS